MKQYKMTIAYDGTDYAGWIQQKDQPSIVQTLQDVFARVFKKEITILGASKTDAGVHAQGQVAVFKTDLAIESQKIMWAWNNALPQAIIIYSLEHDEQFHPHYNVCSKTYYYHLFFERPLPFYARYGTYVPYAIDIDQFKQALQIFKGSHDFQAFYTGNDRSDTMRMIDEIKVLFLEQYNAYRVIIRGRKFLRHMIRRMIGAALAVASRESITQDDIRKALETGITNYELPTAPAQGLMLYAIDYKREKNAT
jgi:tRNA pseudouridine38-40 synthase